MNILIIEDEYLTANRIKKILEEISDEYHVSEIIRSVKQGKEWFKNNEEPDLILSDIELGDGNCFEIYSEYSPQAPIIFLTAYNQYAIHAFKLNSIGYILKPIRKKDIEDNINKFKSLIINNLNNPIIKTETDNVSNNTEKDIRFLIKKGVNFIPILASEIVLFYAESNLTYIITKNNHKYIIEHSLEHLETILDSLHYFRISRSFIIADYAIVKIKKYQSHRLLLDLNLDIPLEIIVSRRKVGTFKEWINQ
jgi:DNA-binding LytR/AlgR family response regulator